MKSITIPKTITNIGNSVFYYCDNLKEVNYEGTQEQWNQITIGYSNDKLKNATINYNYDISSSNK